MSGPTPKNGVTHSRGPKPPELDVAKTLAGRTLLVTGATGFVGKVALSMLLHRYPDVGRVFVLVRPGAGGTPERRFFDRIVPGRPFDPVRATHGDGFERFVREKCVPIAGDVAAPLLGIAEADLAKMEGLAAVVNSAGLVDFNPSLELAVGVNVRGAIHAAELCRRLGAGLLHVSTCFVAGDRDGVVHEDEELDGYFPRRPGVMDRPKRPELDGVTFSVDGELADVERRVAEVRARAEDRVEASRFLDRALERLREEGRSTSDERALKLAAGREKRLWISQQLVALGMDRARHWGWPNTYTYTKSLGEQAIAGSGTSWSIVRPSIVESALRYPFPGWNEGFTTSAPLAFLGLKGQRVFPSAEKAILDIVPVDLVAAAMIAATAELIERARPSTSGAGPAPGARDERTRSRGRVYHLSSGDANPLWVSRSIELSALYRRRFFREREEGNRTVNQLLSRFEPYPVSRRHWEAFSTPAFLALTRAAQKLVKDHAPRWGAPRLSALAGELGQGLDEIEAKLERTQAIWDLYLPFICENRYVFRGAAMRALRARLTPADRARIPWDPEKLDWRHYWLDVHMKGLEEWVFPGLEEESERKVHPIKAHRDLVELLDAAVARHPTRTALRMTGERKDRFTYAELDRFSTAVQRFLGAAGVAKGDRVLLASENRPEWPIAYFGILRAGAVAVPVDAQLSARELENLWRTSGAKVAILSERTLARVPELAQGPFVVSLSNHGRTPAIVLLHEALAGGPPVPAPKVTQDDPASLIFTSGTTGTPKGVVLTHRNFASLVAKLAGVFDLGPGDGMLSVLPLHHTFEFTCGLLVPLARGAEIEYLDELTADSIGDALESGRVTAMIGVPALWSLLHRKITQELSAKPGFVEGAMKGLMKANGWLRDRPLGVNLGKLLFWPVHRRFGGRLRILVSGGAALDPAVLTAFRELGFDLYQGYGLTEAAPVLAVATPAHDAPAGSVGPPLPGVEIRIESPDASGVGEVLARGPNVMLGYWREGQLDPALTAEALENGWLRTGDLGRLDADGNLHLVGRKKDVIIDLNGKNVYPDEIEDLYRDDDLVKELCVVGLPDGAGEKVAMLVVPRFEERERAEVRERLEAHVRKVTQSLPFHQRVKAWHVTEAELPKTATRKVKRRWVQEELARLESAAAAGRRAREAAEHRDAGDGWVLDLVAEIARRPRSEVTHQSTLAGDLALDSLLLNELAAALEQAGVPASLADELPKVQTVGELARLAAGAHRHDGDRPAPKAERKAEEREELPVPRPVAAIGRKILHAGQRALYHSVYDTRVVGEAFIPRDRAFLVVANHASHLDMGLVKIALGDQGERLSALAARDYFFDTPLKRAYFENFTNLIPMERSGALKGSLRAAAEALKRGYHLLIFPEGTRSRDGRLAPFHPTAGYLALANGVDTLPAYISGTHEALPPGAALPKQADLEVRFGPPIAVDDLRARTASLAKGEAYKAATAVMEEAILKLQEEAERDREKTKRRSAPRVPASAEGKPPLSPRVAGGEGRGEGGDRVDRAQPSPPPARKDREPKPTVTAPVREDEP